MRIKAGNTWFEATKDAPIMVELTDADKKNISSMHPDATMYALFADDCSLTADEKLAWMDGKSSGARK